MSSVKINDENTVEIIANDSNAIRLRPRSADTIYTEGVKIASNDWSEEFSLSENETSKEIQIEVTGEGKTSTTYVIKIFGGISFDYDAETILFNDNIYKIFDKNDNEIHSGDSVSEYSVLEGGTSEQEVFKVTDKENGEVLVYVAVPVRQSCPISSIDYSNESINLIYSNRNVWSSSTDDFTEIVNSQSKCNSRI